ncbi:MAG TPA: enoyl-CoA hydratase/isomerase family protein [Methylomirabilota bacterium]|jgi:enoyl-CoA hydratase/carnithine racemase
MTESYVTVEKHGPTAIVRFDRKESRNAFNQQLVRELTEVARAFHDDLETHHVVLAGAADAFSAGADLKDAASWRLAEKTDVQRRHRFYAGVRLCKAWEEMPQITIAAIERMAVGAGVAIALACDWRVLGRGAFLYVPEVQIGLNLQWGALPRLITLVGPARAKRITLMCEKMDAATALAWGLVDELADDGKTVEVALAMARKTAEMPPATVRLVKEAVNATAGALHRAASFADGDQSQLTSSFEAARAARERFGKR